MLRLHSYWRSSSAYRVRIALNLKRLEHELVPVHLTRGGGEQRAPAYRQLNPQQLVPLLEDGEFRLGQSLAICQYLEDRWPEPPLAPAQPQARAQMWSFCQAIACEIQPLQNLRVLQYLASELAVTDDQKAGWIRHWIHDGLAALESQAAARPASRCCFGDAPTYADCCLVPMIYNAERYGVALHAMPRLSEYAANCRAQPAFAAAHPDRQPDAQK